MGKPRNSSLPHTGGQWHGSRRLVADPGCQVTTLPAKGIPKVKLWIGGHFCLTVRSCGWGRPSAGPCAPAVRVDAVMFPPAVDILSSRPGRKRVNPGVRRNFRFPGQCFQRLCIVQERIRRGTPTSESITRSGQSGCVLCVIFAYFVRCGRGHSSTKYFKSTTPQSDYRHGDATVLGKASGPASTLEPTDRDCRSHAGPVREEVRPWFGPRGPAGDGADG